MSAPRWGVLGPSDSRIWVGPRHAVEAIAAANPTMTLMTRVDDDQGWVPAARVNS